MGLEKRLMQKLEIDFGEAGIEYLEVKKKSKGIVDLDSMNHYSQRRFIIELCHGLYDDILPGNRFREFILGLFISLYGFSEAEESVIWRDYFKGVPPIDFVDFFFGGTVGKQLISIEQKKMKINDIHLEDDPLQFSFIINMIGKIFKNYPYLKDRMNSVFTKYVLYGEEKSKTKFEQFVKENNVEEIVFSFKEYLMQNMNDQNINEVKNVIEIIDLNKKSSTFTQTGNVPKKQGVEIKIRRNIENEIQGELGKYINQRESSQLIRSAKASASINEFESADSNQKQKFLNKILENSSVTSSSSQRENLVRHWMSRILDI